MPVLLFFFGLGGYAGLKSRLCGFVGLRAFSGVKGGFLYWCCIASFSLAYYTWTCILYHEVVGDRPLGFPWDVVRHEQAGHGCSRGAGVEGILLRSWHFMVEGEAR